MTPPKLWLLTDKGDQDCRLLADGHYSRQTIGATGFCRNGQNLVFITDDLAAAWVTFRPTPGVATRADKLDAWECSLFCNRGPHLSSLLIREAVALTCAVWGSFPPDGFITFVKQSAVKSDLKGYCYRRAGWKHWGESKDGKLRMRAPRPRTMEPVTNWRFRDGKGGVLARRLSLEFFLADIP